jgi:rare lipoprotein A
MVITKKPSILFMLLLLLLVLAQGLQAEEFQRGIASWYGGKFQGRRTASGEVFDTYQFTAAHRTLPFGTVVKVTNLENRRAVTVRINDRGPFVDGRVIDLSYAAANTLDMVRSGVARVGLEIVSSPSTMTRQNRTMPQPGTVIIQVGSYGDRDNAAAAQRRLSQAGISAQLEEVASQGRPGGLIRVVIPNVPAAQTQNYLNRLSALGYTRPLVRQTR